MQQVQHAESKSDRLTTRQTALKSLILLSNWLRTKGVTNIFYHSSQMAIQWWWYCWWKNPAPLDRQFVPLFTGFSTSQVVIAGFLPSTVSLHISPQTCVHPSSLALFKIQDSFFVRKLSSHPSGFITGHQVRIFQNAKSVVPPSSSFWRHVHHGQPWIHSCPEAFGMTHGGVEMWISIEIPDFG